MDNKNSNESKKILIVDDSLLSSKITSKFLGENGYYTENVTTGEAAIQKATSNSHPDLILMDIELDDKMSGIDSAREIIKRVNIPVVFYTSNASIDIINKIKKICAYGYVVKGVDKISLLSTVDMALNLHEANKEIENNRQQYLELAEYAPIGIIKCDHKGNIVFINHYALEILGSPSIKETKKINLLTSPFLVYYGLSEKVEKCLHTNTPSTYESEYKSKWGKNLYLRIHMKPFINRGTVINAQIIIDDITEKKRLENEMRMLTLIDPLTTAYNRRFFLQKLENEIERIQRQETGTFSLLMLDIDNFKSKNDNFGHNYGDIVLKKLTKAIKDRIRKTDCLARWGGEEFVILIQDTPLDHALILAEALREIVSQLEFSTGDNVTASFGIAEYCLGDTIDSLIQKVDTLMYQAKKSGKNCVRSA